MCCSEQLQNLTAPRRLAQTLGLSQWLWRKRHRPSVDYQRHHSPRRATDRFRSNSSCPEQASQRCVPPRRTAAPAIERAQDFAAASPGQGSYLELVRRPESPDRKTRSVPEGIRPETRSLVETLLTSRPNEAEHRSASDLLLSNQFLELPRMLLDSPRQDFLLCGSGREPWRTPVVRTPAYPGKSAERVRWGLRLRHA